MFPDKSVLDVMVSDLGQRLDAIGLESQVQQFLVGPQGAQLLEGVVRYIQASTEATNVTAETRDEHPEWFEGLC